LLYFLLNSYYSIILLDASHGYDAFVKNSSIVNSLFILFQLIERHKHICLINSEMMIILL
ncbi:MAG TPA: hypothetical protein VE445_12115, partial [Nitrososphaeraceae archaeon]|nr:hypothetical protein [Nitrososphaeraceae archaeon]